MSPKALQAFKTGRNSYGPDVGAGWFQVVKAIKYYNNARVT